MIDRFIMLAYVQQADKQSYEKTLLLVAFQAW